METDEQLRRLACPMRREGLGWGEVADELGCTASIARAMADRY
ncbi:hypothetical protein QM787_22240 [Rhodococcus ruber]|uniref:Uncharacterized protein n=1 Tax=Rhodococcus ruber TaxID=1830 RepID=A0A098BFG5_9NOCA|nr:hypothetical protein [Rhodococcus ruber]MCZ4505413.1 hypothetical protein [Rhodococcus ruber]MCZ4532844.1 hypothetical protein [Rhodococcus ruber]MCZ4532889.1 hypothetical protein [Rhodococcus ruber]MCZ4623017.1 hypothetical protein [Rhodococcus ruber]MDI9984340.1 hypothetical protein [Rhodococcus ruber]